MKLSSDYHKVVFSFFKSTAPRLKTKIIFHRSYKTFDESSFLKNLKQTKFEFLSEDPNENYNALTTKFSEIIKKYAPLIKKYQRGNQAPFINKQF